MMKLILLPLLLSLQSSFVLSLGMSLLIHHGSLKMRIHPLFQPDQIAVIGILIVDPVVA